MQIDDEENSMAYPRLLPAPTESFFLWGCRGTGKSTWLRQSFPDARWFDLLDEALYQRFLAAPALFAAELRAAPIGSWVVVDEVQRLPNLLNEVHRAMEERQLRFALCGSSARKIRRAGVNLLGGRALLKRMHPFVADELGPDFDIEAALTWGTVPLVWGAENRAERLAAYTQLYLKEEIQAEALVRNLPGFARFLPLAALLHGQSLNVSNIARDAGVARTTVAGYLDILDETMLTFRVPAFEGRLRVRERRHPKLYWTDPGIVRGARRFTGDVHPEERGALFEGLVAQHVRAAMDYRNLGDSLYYWAPAGSRDTEVDFLVAKGDRFAAIEAKSGPVFHESWCKGLRAVAGLAGLSRRLLVTPSGPTMMTRDGIEVIPFARLVESVRDGSLL
jgi:predicted AAA+ superfamily ATPase